jgi:hypothetical protein
LGLVPLDLAALDGLSRQAWPQGSTVPVLGGIFVMTEAIRKAVVDVLPKLQSRKDMKLPVEGMKLTNHERDILIAALEALQGVADGTRSIVAPNEKHEHELRAELDRRDETINSYKKLLAYERAEVERLKLQLATARNDMTPREKSIEAAAKAKFKADWSHDDWDKANEARKNAYIEPAIIYINAYLAALEAEGGAKCGWGVDRDNGDWLAGSTIEPLPGASMFPVLIIKL